MGFSCLKSGDLTLKRPEPLAPTGNRKSSRHVRGLAPVVAIIDAILEADTGRAPLSARPVCKNGFLKKVGVSALYAFNMVSLLHFLKSAMNLPARLTQLNLMVLSIAFSSLTHAQVYKCKDPQGKANYSDIPCSSVAEKIRITPNDFGESTNAMPSARSGVAMQSTTPENKREIEKLSRREDELTRRLDEEREQLSSQSIGNLGPARTRIRSIQDELHSVQIQKRALLGHASVSADNDDKIQQLERRVDGAERSARKPIVDNFRMNGKNCQRVGDSVNCF